MEKKQEQLDVGHCPEAETSLWWSCLSWSLNLWKILKNKHVITFLLQSSSHPNQRIWRKSPSHPNFLRTKYVHPISESEDVASRLVMVIHTHTLLAAISWMPGLSARNQQPAATRAAPTAEAPTGPCRRRWCFYFLHLQTLGYLGQAKFKARGQVIYINILCMYNII
jgi:hypothetical protein